MSYPFNMDATETRKNGSSLFKKKKKAVGVF